MTKQSGIGRRRSAAKEDASSNYQTRRDEIAKAAVRVFNRMGLEPASLKAVADELGSDRASLYYYFSSKDELFDDVVRSVVEKNYDLVKRIEASKVSPHRKLRELITGLMTSYGEHYPLLYIYIRENLSQVSDQRSAWSKYMRDLNRKTSDLVIAIVEQGYADGTFRKVGSPRVVAYGVLGIVGWTNRWFRPESSDVSAEEIGKVYAEMILSGLESPY
jgi:TetR/AcrR family transcriptional regulator, cholesterol catabolism regulator